MEISRDQLIEILYDAYAKAKWENDQLSKQVHSLSQALEEQLKAESNKKQEEESE